MTREPLSSYTGAPGWRQFLANKAALLANYECAQVWAQGHEVHTVHGHVAEASFRRWLAEFLPGRFGVTSGFIVSSKSNVSPVFPHYDVVVYDKLESPILWVEGSSDRSDSGLERAIPAEHTLAVIEVKAAFTKPMIKGAMAKLGELTPFLEGIDAPGEPYPKWLPPTFCSAVVFFELRTTDRPKLDDLSELVPDRPLRGYFGGMVLRAQALDAGHTGKVYLLRGKEPIAAMPGGAEGQIVGTLATSASKEWGPDRHVSAALSWAPAFFSEFAFELLGRLRGTLRPGYVPSWHGSAWLDPSRRRSDGAATAEEAGEPT